MKDVNCLVKMKDVIYADNAATTKIDNKAYIEMQRFLKDDYSNPSQPYVFSKESKLALKRAREIIAKCINAEPEEIVFTSGGTESDNWAINGIMLLHQKNKRMITDEIEHHAILNTCKFIEKIGYGVDYVTVNNVGQIEISNLEKKISEDTVLISIMMANNEIGTIQPIKDLCNLAHKNNIIFHTDAVQAIGHIPIDVKDLGVDLMSASAHKFNGPKGIGFLYIKSGINVESMLHGGRQEFGLRAGTENVAAIVAMAIALQNNCVNIETNLEKTKEVERFFLGELQQTQFDYIINGDLNNKLPGIINISFKNANGEMLLHRLDLKGICVSTGSACDSVENQISHVIKAIKVSNEYAEGTIRISFCKENTQQEAKQIVQELYNILNN